MDYDDDDQSRPFDIENDEDLEDFVVDDDADLGFYEDEDEDGEEGEAEGEADGDGDGDGDGDEEQYPSADQNIDSFMENIKGFKSPLDAFKVCCIKMLLAFLL